MPAEVLPYLVSLGETLSREHVFVRNEEEGSRCDGIDFPLGLILGIFEHVDIIGDAFHVQIAVMYLIFHRQHIEGMEATA